MPTIVDLREGKELQRGVAEVYCEVFAGDPWRETNRVDQVMADMEEHFAKPKAVALALVAKDSRPVGFTWAYQLLRNGLAEGTRHPPTLDPLFEGTNGDRTVFYLQEIGVHPKQQGQGLGRRLSLSLLDGVKARGAELVVLSTRPDAESMVRLISSLGFRNLGIVRPPEELGRTFWTLDLKDQ